jgi:arylamine N-acetyltransferase
MPNFKPAGMWTDRYLTLLGLDSPQYTPEWLARFGSAHLRHVPFANVTSLLRRAAAGEAEVPALDLEAQLSACEQGTAGGVCFEVATMVWHLLEALGFDAYPVLGQITFPGSHQAVVVRLEDGQYLVDLGNGAPLPDPIPLDRVSQYHAAGLSFRFRPDLDSMECFQDRLIHGDWVTFCNYNLQPATDAERGAAYQRHHDPAESWVASSITLVCYVQDEDMVLQVRDGAFTRHMASGKETARLGACAEYERLVREEMGLPNFAIAEALVALKQITGIEL